MMEANNWFSLIVGIIVSALGLIPLLNMLKVISFGGQFTGFYAILFSWVLAVAGIYLLIDAFMENDAIGWTTGIVAFLILSIGVLNALASFGVKILPFKLPDLVYLILLLVEGILLIVAGFAAD